MRKQRAGTPKTNHSKCENQEGIRTPISASAISDIRRPRSLLYLRPILFPTAYFRFALSANAAFHSRVGARHYLCPFCQRIRQPGTSTEGAQLAYGGQPGGEKCHNTVRRFARFSACMPRCATARINARNSNGQPLHYAPRDHEGPQCGKLGHAGGRQGTARSSPPTSIWTGRQMVCSSLIPTG